MKFFTKTGPSSPQSMGSIAYIILLALVSLVSPRVQSNESRTLFTKRRKVSLLPVPLTVLIATTSF